MPITTYDTVNGQIVGQSTGGVHTAYLRDAGGNVTATRDSNGVVNLYEYTPLGQLRSRSGKAPDPVFLWRGGYAYRATSAPSADIYAIEGSYSSAQGSWLGGLPGPGLGSRTLNHGRPFARAYPPCDPLIADPITNEICKEAAQRSPTRLCNECGNWCRCGGKITLKFVAYITVNVEPSWAPGLGYVPCLYNVYEYRPCPDIPVGLKQNCPPQQKCSSKPKDCHRFGPYEEKVDRTQSIDVGIATVDIHLVGSITFKIDAHLTLVSCVKKPESAPCS